jgi:hypothetical protein
MTDIGAGVYEYPDDDRPVNGRVGPAVPSHVPTCPACGLHDATERSDNPDFAYLCGSCWTLFTGTELEWRRMRRLREDVARRREALAEQEREDD